MELTQEEVAAMARHKKTKLRKSKIKAERQRRNKETNNFAEFDKDSSGGIEKDEFLAAGLGTSEDFDAADVDGSGTIDLREYIEMTTLKIQAGTDAGKSVDETLKEAEEKLESTRKKRIEMQARLEKHLKKHNAGYKDKFNAIDHDGSGELDKDEFIKAGLGTAKDFARFDEDKSGTVSIIEYQKFQVKKKQRLRLEQDRRSIRKLNKEKNLITPEQLEAKKRAKAARKERLAEFRKKKVAKQKAEAAMRAARAAYAAMSSNIITQQCASDAMYHFEFSHAEREARMGRIDSFTTMQNKKWERQQKRKRRREESSRRRQLEEARAAAAKLEELLGTPGIDAAASRIQTLYRARRGRKMFKAMLNKIFSKEWDEWHQAYYYQNHETGEAQWDKPKLLKDEVVHNNEKRLRSIELEKIEKRFSKLALNEENEYDDFGNDVTIYAPVGGYDGIRYNYLGKPIIDEDSENDENENDENEKGENEMNESKVTKPKWEDMTEEEREFVSISKLQGMYRRKLVRRNILTGEIRYRAPQLQGIKTSVNDNIKEATKNIFGTDQVTLLRIVVKTLIGGSSGYVIDPREYLGAPETDSFCAFSIPMPNTVAFKVQEATKPQRQRLYTPYTKTINKRMETSEGHMTSWTNKLQFHAYYSSLPGTDRFDVYWKRDGATRNYFKCARKAADPWGWFFMYSFYAYPLVRIDVYKSLKTEHTYYFSGSEKMTNIPPPDPEEFEHEFSFYALQYQMTGTINFNCMHTDKRQVGDDPGITRSLRSRCSSEAPHSIWEHNCQFYAFDTPIRGTNRLQIQISIDDPVRYRITPEFMIKGPWRHLNTVYVLGIVSPDAVKFAHGAPDPGKALSALVS